MQMLYTLVQTASIICRQSETAHFLLILRPDRLSQQQTTSHSTFCAQPATRQGRSQCMSCNSNMQAPDIASSTGNTTCLVVTQHCAWQKTGVSFATDLCKVVPQEVKPQLTVGDICHVCIVCCAPISLLSQQRLRISSRMTSIILHITNYCW